MSLTVASALAAMQAALPPTLLDTANQFAKTANSNKAAERIYGIKTFANTGSKVKVNVAKGVLSADVTLKSTGTEGYSANAGVVIPLTPDGTAQNLWGLDAINFEYRLDARISDQLMVGLESDAYPADIDPATIYQDNVIGAANLSASKTWKSASLNVMDFATPAWWTPPVDFATMDQVLSRATALRIQPMSLYSASGTINGSPCAKCVGPVTKSVGIELRKFRFSSTTVQQPPPLTTIDAFSIEAPDSASVNRVYAVQTFSNPSSQANCSVSKGVLTASYKLASDGLNGYTANVGVLVPLQGDWMPLNMSSLRTISFQFRNDQLITDQLSVTLGSSAYPMVPSYPLYENNVTASSLRAASTTFKNVTLDVADFAIPAWWTAPADYPALDQVFRSLKNLSFEPRSTYSSSGTQDGNPCIKCVGPTMSSIKLELKNIALDYGTGTLFLGSRIVGSQGGAGGAVANPEMASLKSQKGTMPAVAWHQGALELQNPSQWTSVRILGLDGRELESLHPEARMGLRLPNGSYLAVLEGANGLRQSMQVLVQH